MSTNESQIDRLWAKIGLGSAYGDGFHPLPYHLLDVANASLQLWDTFVPKAIRAGWAEALRTDESTAGGIVSFLVGLHDIGKATPVFQRQGRGAEAALRAIGLDFGDSPKALHGTLTSAWIMSDECVPRFQCDETRLQIALALGGHHGRFPAVSAVADLVGPVLGGQAWKEARRELLVQIADILDVDLRVNIAMAWNEETMPLVVHLAGLVTLADWVGSSEEDFPYEAAGGSLADYATRSRERAARAIGRIPFRRMQPPAQAAFEEVFPKCNPPRPLQSTVAEYADSTTFPALLLIEAPTGEGKTEAALYAAEAALRAGATGFYLAMPTQATSNQMHDRAEAYRRTRLADGTSPAVLLHSAALLRLRASANDEDQDKVGTAAWFYGRKRGLLTSLGVGTIDQSLLATMRTKHGFLRLCGLSTKVIVFDEVHAYDTYMNVLLQRLLEWLGTVGATVVLLSATLPPARRKELVEAYLGRPIELGSTPYPRLTAASQGSVKEVPFAAAAERRMRVDLEWIFEEALAGLIRERVLPAGGCVAVIRNRVQAAQDTFRTLSASLADTDAEVVLFHSRFPFQWRMEVEEGLKGRLGRSGESRPRCMVVVATQVIEQSLDLDFDWLVTDSAPTDLILQRVGRLHRHQRIRPPQFTLPRLTLFEPTECETGVPSFGQDEYIYARSVLLRSWAILRAHSFLLLPDEVEGLVEQTYAPEFATCGSDDFHGNLRKAEEDFRDQCRKHQAAAERVAVPSPSRLDPFSWADIDLQDDEDPRMHEAVRAATRLGSSSVSVCCISAGQLVTDPQTSAIHEDGVDVALAQKILAASLPLAHRGLVRYLATQETPSSWRSHPLLRYHKVIDFSDGSEAFVDRLRLRISRSEGLVIERESEALP
jgi:CRISPR-associated endonuclease/helicase Cas3